MGQGGGGKVRLTGLEKRIYLCALRDLMVGTKVDWWGNRVETEMVSRYKATDPIV